MGSGMIRRNGEDDDKEDSQKLDWLGDFAPARKTDKLHVQSRSKDQSSGNVLEHRDVSVGNDRFDWIDGGIGGANPTAKSPRRGTSGRRDADERKTDSVEESVGISKGTVSVRLHDIRQALDDTAIMSLLHRTYNPDDTISVHPTYKKTAFVEDCMLIAPKPKVAKKIIGKILPPSEAAAILVDDTAPVLCAYFVKYKKYFGEEDSAWTGNAGMSKAIRLVKMFKNSTGVTNEDIVAFIDKIIPLWARRLRDNAGFPNSRPSLQMLFEGKRFYWSNRNLLYRQWSCNRSE